MKLQIKILFSIIFLFSVSLKASAVATFVQTIRTNVPSAVNVTSLNPSQAQGTINAQTGNSSSPSVSFQLQTNGADDDYKYVLQSTLLTTGGVNVNAYAKIGTQGYLMLGNNNPTLYPTAAGVSNITAGTPTASLNPNVIAYPVTNLLTNLASATLSTSATYGGLYYSIKTGTSQNGTIQQTLGVAPLANTYSIQNDRAGTYQAVLTFTANRNP